MSRLARQELKMKLAQELSGPVAVLLGGESSEREVSLESGKAVLDALSGLGLDVQAIDVTVASLLSDLKNKEIKHCFIALHGGAGEDGRVQAILESSGITYTGSGVLGCALAMDKGKTKFLWQGAGIATAPFVLVSDAMSWADVKMQLGCRKAMFKPANEGSSIGMTVVTDEASFTQAIKTAKQYDTDLIAEKWIEGPEYTVAILAQQALPMIQMKTEHDFYDYEAKYQSNDTQYICPCGLDEKLECEIQSQAVKAFDLLACSGWGRVDVMLDENQQFFFLEANTVPGMTSHSLVPMAAKAVGLEFDELVGNLLLQSIV